MLLDLWPWPALQPGVAARVWGVAAGGQWSGTACLQRCSHPWASSCRAATPSIRLAANTCACARSQHHVGFPSLDTNSLLPCRYLQPIAAAAAAAAGLYYLPVLFLFSGVGTELVAFCVKHPEVRLVLVHALWVPSCKARLYLTRPRGEGPAVEASLTGRAWGRQEVSRAARSAAHPPTDCQQQQQQ